jgi:hypothetical protein
MNAGRSARTCSKTSRRVPPAAVSPGMSDTWSTQSLPFPGRSSAKRASGSSRRGRSVTS